MTLLWLALAVAKAQVVVGLSSPRGGQSSLDGRGLRDVIDDQLPRATVRAVPTFTAASLRHADVVVIIFGAHSHAAIRALSESETDAIVAFVADGGGLVVASDNPTFQGTANQLLERFGLTSEGYAPGWHTTSQLDRDRFSAIVDGPFGRVESVGGGYIGSYSILGDFEVVATWDTGLIGRPSLVARDNGEGGRIVVSGEAGLITADQPQPRSLLLNALIWAADPGR